MLKEAPPRTNLDIPIFHSVKKVYSIIYKTGNTLAKRDKLSIHLYIEKTCLKLFEEIISAAFLPKSDKTMRLKEARMLLEKLKHLIRLEYEMNIISQKIYIETESTLIESSKMINGWLSYLARNPANK